MNRKELTDLSERLSQDAESLRQLGCDMDATGFGSADGVLISGNEAQKVSEFINNSLPLKVNLNEYCLIELTKAGAHLAQMKGFDEIGDNNGQRHFFKLQLHQLIKVFGSVVELNEYIANTEIVIER